MRKLLSITLLFLFLVPLISFAQEVAAPIVEAVTPAVSLDWLDAILAPLMTKYAWLSVTLMILGTLVILGQAVVVITPTKKDDAFVNKIKKIPVLGLLIVFIEKFAIFKK